MSNIPSTMQAALEELENYSHDVQQISPQMEKNTIQRYVSRLDTDPIDSVVRTILPHVDFDPWYDAASKTGSSSIGTAELNWPYDDVYKRIALWIEFLRRVSKGKIGLLSHSATFYSYDKYNPRSYPEQFIRKDFKPFHRDLMRLLQQANGAQTRTATSSGTPYVYEYISHDRITELKELTSENFDLKRLIRLCEEININFQSECWLAVAMLTRALIDHVPPIFQVKSFNEVVNNYGEGGRSFKDSMRHLNSSRYIADNQLHGQIRRQEDLPTATQVNFAPVLDKLLSEIICILRQ